MKIIWPKQASVFPLYFRFVFLKKNGHKTQATSSCGHPNIINLAISLVPWFRLLANSETQDLETLVRHRKDTGICRRLRWISHLRVFAMTMNARREHKVCWSRRVASSCSSATGHEPQRGGSHPNLYRKAKTGDRLQLAAQQQQVTALGQGYRAGTTCQLRQI